MNNDNGDDDRTVIYTGASSPAARLVCLDTMLDASLQDLDIRLGVQDETIGRSDNNSICIKFNKLSRNHARISLENGKWIIQDLNSANGIYINEQRVTKSAMGQGDIVVIGQIPFRFEIENAPAGSAPEPVAAPVDAYEGDSGTMYAQHVGVIESLVTDDKEDEQLEDLPPPPPSAAARVEAGGSAASQKVLYQKVQKKGGAFKYVFLLVLVAAAGGGYFYWQKNSRSHEIDELHVRYSKSVQYFLEKYESNNTRTPSTTLDKELEDIRKIAARVDVALEQGRDHEGLKQLKQKLLFLSFERELLKLLREKAFFDADRIIKNTREEIGTIEIRRVKDKLNYDSMLDLAKTAVRFKRFSDQFPDATPASDRVPDEYELRKMIEVKSDFIDKKKENYLLLSVTYTRLHQLLENIEEVDIRLLNRWQEIRKRQTNS